jgi:cell division protein FtsQ
MTEPELDPVIDLDARRVVTPKKRRRMLVAIFMLIAAIAAGWIVWFSSLLTSEEVSVVGVDGAPAQEIYHTAQVPLGVPLAQLDTQLVTDQLKGISWVESVDVRRGWPHDVVIAVTPRTAIAVTPAGLAVDIHGISFTPTGTVASGLPIVKGDGVGRVAAMGVLSSLPADLHARVAKLAASTRDNVELTLKSGVVVRWGSVEEGELKSQVARALLKRNAKVFDVSSPEQPTTFKEKVKGS